jgi:hypothetical protein
MTFKNIIPPPTRFAVIMSPDLAQDMKDIEDETGLSSCEIFRRAIALYKLSKQCQRDGGNVILREPDGTLKECVNF